MTARHSLWRVPLIHVLLLLAFPILQCSIAAAHEPGEDGHDPPAPPPPPAPILPSRTGPMLLERVEPVYPAAAREQSIGGTVSLDITVADDGRVADVKLVKGTGFGLDEAAIEAARHFRFKPATDKGKPVASSVLFDQHFTVKTRLSAEAAAEPPPTESHAEPTTAAASPSTDKPPATDAGAAASKYESTLADRGPRSTASSSTVRNLDFDLRPKTSPNDILRVVPGLLAVQHQGGGKADQLFLRGFDADHGTDVGVFIDGIPINLPSHAHGQGFADLHFLIPEAIERIDVVKGPYDVRFGDFSTAGALNLITRKDFEESSVAMTLGSFPTQGCNSFPVHCAALASQRFLGIVSPHFKGWAEKLHVWIAFEAAHDDGPFDNPERLNRYNLFAKLSYDLSPGTSIGMFVSAYGSGWVGSGQIPAREVDSGRLRPFGAVDPSEGGLTERQMFTAFVKHKDGDNEFIATAYVTRYKLALFNDFTFFLEDPVRGSEIEQDDARTVSGARLEYHFHRHVRALSFRTTAGAEVRYDAIHVDRWDASSQGDDFRVRLNRHVDTSPFHLAGSNSDVTQLNIAGFLEEDLVVNPYFRAIAGLRADYFGFNVSDLGEKVGQDPVTSGSPQKALVSPKATVVISPIPKTLDFYLNFGMGFHTNQAQIALLDGQSKVNGQDLGLTVHAAPRIYGGEVGARLKLIERIDLAATFWVSYLENETVFDADHAVFSPSLPTLRLGVDAEVRVRIMPWLFADFDLAQARATAKPDVGNGGAVALAPKIYMTGGLTVKHKIGIRAGLRFRYVGPRPAFDETSAEYQYFSAKTLANGQANPDYNPERVNTAAYTVVDAYFAYRIKFFEVQLSVQNLFNSAWREAQFGNHSCTFDEANNSKNPNYAGSGNTLSDGSFANRCGIAYHGPGGVTDPGTRSGVTDVHYTPGVPINLQLTAKFYF